MRTRINHAFTLIELLVVIAIIAILAAILFPVFAQAREKARSVSCLSDTKQIGLSLQMYTQDFDETIPQAYYYVSANGIGRMHWSKMLTPYTKNDDIFACPSDISPTPIGFSGGFPDAQAPRVSYIPNYAVLPAWDAMPVSLAAIGAPAGVIAFAEKRNYVCTKQTKTYAGVAPFVQLSAVPMVWRYLSFEEVAAGLAGCSTGGLGRVDYKRHQEGSNYAFLDGHSKWMRMEQTIPGKLTDDLSTPVKTQDHRLWGETDYSNGW